MSLEPNVEQDIKVKDPKLDLSIEQYNKQRLDLIKLDQDLDANEKLHLELSVIDNDIAKFEKQFVIKCIEQCKRTQKGLCFTSNGTEILLKVPVTLDDQCLMHGAKFWLVPQEFDAKDMSIKADQSFIDNLALNTKVDLKDKDLSLKFNALMSTLSYTHKGKTIIVTLDLFAYFTKYAHTMTIEPKLLTDMYYYIGLNTNTKERAKVNNAEYKSLIGKLTNKGIDMMCSLYAIIDLFANEHLRQDYDGNTNKEFNKLTNSHVVLDIDIKYASKTRTIKCSEFVYKNKTIEPAEKYVKEIEAIISADINVDVKLDRKNYPFVFTCGNSIQACGLAGLLLRTTTLEELVANYYGLELYKFKH